MNKREIYLDNKLLTTIETPKNNQKLYWFEKDDMFSYNVVKKGEFVDIKLLTTESENLELYYCISVINKTKKSGFDLIYKKVENCYLKKRDVEEIILKKAMENY